MTRVIPLRIRAATLVAPFVVSLVAGTVAARAAEAQQAPASPPAAAAAVAAWPALPALPQRVRLGLPEGRFVGDVLTAEEDSILVQTKTTAGAGDAPVFSQRWLHVACVRSAEVPVGQVSRRRAALRYSLFGALGGAVAGAVIGKSQASGRRPHYIYEPAIEPHTVRLVTRNAIGVGLGGAAIGAVVGYFRPSEHWRSIETPPVWRSTRWVNDERDLQRCPVRG